MQTKPQNNYYFALTSSPALR